MNLNGNLGNTGIPTKIAIPLGAVVAFGGYHFIQQWRAGKAASTAASSANSGGGGSTGSLAATDSPYGPNTGDPAIQMTTTNSGFGDGQYTALSNTSVGITQQNQAIMDGLALNVDQQVTTNKALASLLAVNPGALQQYKALPPNAVYEKAVQSQMTAAVANIFPGVTGVVPGGVTSS